MVVHNCDLGSWETEAEESEFKAALRRNAEWVLHGKPSPVRYQKNERKGRESRRRLSRESTGVITWALYLEPRE